MVRKLYNFDVALKGLLDVLEDNLNQALANHEVSKSFSNSVKCWFTNVCVHVNSTGKLRMVGKLSWQSETKVKEFQGVQNAQDSCKEKD